MEVNIKEQCQGQGSLAWLSDMLGAKLTVASMNKGISPQGQPPPPLPSPKATSREDPKTWVGLRDHPSLKRTEEDIDLPGLVIEGQS